MNRCFALVLSVVLFWNQALADASLELDGLSTVMRPAMVLSYGGEMPQKDWALAPVGGAVAAVAAKPLIGAAAVGAAATAISLPVIGLIALLLVAIIGVVAGLAGGKSSSGGSGTSATPCQSHGSHSSSTPCYSSASRPPLPDVSLQGFVNYLQGGLHGGIAGGTHTYDNQVPRLVADLTGIFSNYNPQMPPMAAVHPGSRARLLQIAFIYAGGAPNMAVQPYTHLLGAPAAARTHIRNLEQRQWYNDHHETQPLQQAVASLEEMIDRCMRTVTFVNSLTFQAQFFGTLESVNTNPSGLYNFYIVFLYNALRYRSV